MRIAYHLSGLSLLVGMFRLLLLPFNPIESRIGQPGTRYRRG
jgi:hypothetical protein